jgi:3',5'-cyclic AMP phosphodiesterase CpdA
MLTIAQITDLHITTDKDPLNKARNEKRLRTVLKAIHERRPRPVAIIASGDLVDRGEHEEYIELKKIFDEVEIPLYLGLGNHDRRASFRAVFPQTPVDQNGFVQYAVDLGGVRLVMCDTLDEGNNDGAFCDKRAAGLRRLLKQDKRTPTIVALHHPPIISGIQWMDPLPDAEWIKRLAKTIEGRTQIRNLICGHVHRAFHGILAGQLVSASPATSIQLTLNLTPVDLRVPDGREILVEEPPGYSLFLWDKARFITHVCVAGDFAPAVTYDVPFVTD